MKTSFYDKKELIDALVSSSDIVLDVGFWGQGVSVSSPHWVHNMSPAQAAEVWCIDIEYDDARLLATPSRGGPQDARFYRRMSAESFTLPQKFDVIFAGDLIEHLPNPGLFLERARAHLKPRGRLVMTTPNCFNLFSIVEKFTKGEPSVNRDHTCYFNERTLRQLLGKCGFDSVEHAFMWRLDVEYKESWKKKILNIFYTLIGSFSPRFLETLVVVAKNK